MSRFSMKDLGELRTYLGPQMVSDADSFTVHVAPYIAQLVAHYLPEPSPPVLTPADPNLRLSVLMGPEPTSDEF
jgi:hypothetical protein